MTRAALLFIMIAGGAVQSPAPQIQNGRVESRQTAAIGREMLGIAAGAVDPVWAAWRVPIAAGQRGECCTYSDDSTGPYGVRGCFVEGSTTPQGGGVPQIAAPAGPVPIEAGSGLVILVRFVDTHVERMRTLGDDCPIDAGGRSVIWLQGVTTADSLAYLDGLVRQNGILAPSQERRLSEAAVSAIALHRDAAADVVLDRLANADTESSMRRLARTLLGSTRGAHGFATLKPLLDTERLPDLREQLVTAISQTRQPGTADVLLTIARTDPTPKVRAEAIYWLPQRGGPRVTSDVTAILDNDTSDKVKQRGVQGLARLGADDSTPLLIQLALTSKSPIVRKEAVTALGQSKDPRALQFLEDLLK